MAIGDPYASIATLKARLNISDTIDDAVATLAVNSATLQIEGVTGRQFNTNGAASGSGAGVSYTGTGLVDTGAAFYAAQVGQVVTSGANTATITAVTNATTLLLTAWAPGTPSAAAAYSIPAPLVARIYYPDSPTLVYTDDFASTSGLILAADYGNDGVYELTWLAANYQVEPINGIFDGTPGWPYYRIRAINQYYPLWWGAVGSPRASLQVTAQWGWASVPAGVQEACLLLAEEIFKLKDAPFGVAGFGAMGAVRVRENPKVMALLERYIRTPILAR